MIAGVVHVVTSCWGKQAHFVAACRHCRLKGTKPFYVDWMRAGLLCFLGIRLLINFSGCVHHAQRHTFGSFGLGFQQFSA